MKKRLLPGVALLAAAVFAGCQADNFEMAQGEGSIAVQVAVDANIRTATPMGGRAEYSDVTPADLSLKLESTDGTYSQQWGSVSDFPTDGSFKVGQYTMTAWYGEQNKEGFECPYFEGSTQFYVQEGKAAQVSLTAALQNALVTVDYTDAFVNFMSDYSAQLHSAGGAYIDYVHGETRPAYLNPGQVTLMVSFTKQNGVGATVQAAQFTAEAKHHYTVTVDVNGGEVGDAQLVVTFDDSISQEAVTLDLSDEILSASAPAISAEGFTHDTAIYSIEGTTPDEALKMNIVARGTLSAVTLTTQSASLLKKGWPAEIDLMGATADQQAALKALGFDARGLWHNPDQFATLDFTGVLSHIAYVEDASEHAFTVVARDKYMKVTEPLTLKVNIQPVRFAITGNETFMVNDATLTLVLDFNGGNPKNAVKFYYLNERGTWTAAAIHEVVSNGDGTWNVTIDSPADQQPLQVKAVYGEKELEPVTIQRTWPAFSIGNNALDTFATSTRLTLASDEAEVSMFASSVAVEVSTDGTNYSAASATVNSDNSLKVSGLQPSTTYSVRALLGDKTAGPITITTEAATQLPNGDMETWYTVAGSTKYWWTEYPGADENAAWGTVNQLTVSKGGSSTNMFNHTGCSYCAFSGTRGVEASYVPYNGDSSEPAHVYAGSKAAAIETVGWGKNDANGGTLGCSGTLTPGELYLGAYDSSASAPNYSGLAFTSRPAALTFYYQYFLYNSADYGMAEVTVYDASGNAICTNYMQISAQREWAQATLPLTYPAGAAKAAKIQVRFKSSDNSACWDFSTSNMSCPSFGNLSDGRFIGSRLYVDNIELVY